MAITRYKIRVYDTNGVQQAEFDDWLSLQFSRKVNDFGSYTLKFRDTGDARFDEFVLDAQVKIMRRITGIDSPVDWYDEFCGFHRNPKRYVEASGEQSFESIGVGFNELLARRAIMYKEGTIRADKNDAAETVMKEFVQENCTSTGDLTAVGRLNYDNDAGVLLYSCNFPGFSVETDGGNGVNWTGSRPYENLLDVLQDIAEMSAIDFAVVDNGVAQFQFRTYTDQMGTDRTENNGVVAPVIFMLGFGNIEDVGYEWQRMGEVNAVCVLGKGDGSTRTTKTRNKPSTQDDSPWNVREATRSASSYDEDYEDYSLRTSGDEILEELKAKLGFSFQPLQQDSAIYGVHYFLGDRVTVNYGGLTVDRKIVGVNIAVDENGEQVSLELSEIPGS